MVWRLIRTYLPVNVNVQRIEFCLPKSMIRFLVVICISLFAGAMTNHVSRISNRNVYSYFAQKYKVLDKQALQSHTLLSNGPVMSTGYIIESSYSDSTVCNAEDVYGISFIALGTCGIYHADYSDSAAVPHRCGTYVTPTAYRVISDYNGEGNLILTYTFYTDAACTIPGVGSECTQTIGIASDCFKDVDQNSTSSYNSTFSDVLNLPTVGLFGNLYNKANCTGAPLSGSWQRTGCEKIAQSLSVSTVCSDTTFEFWEYNTTGTCTGPTDYYYSGALNSCQENVFDDEDDITSVQYGLGWIKYTYSSSTPSSPRPSFQPTHMSTSAPTVQTSPIVTFTSNVTLENLTSQTLDQVSINAILSAQASSMIIPVSAVSFITFSGSLAAATEEQTATSSRHTSLRSFAGKMKVMAGFNMVVTTRSTIALSATTYASTADLYESLTSNLVTAVNDDVYGAYLRASGVPELASAGASDASSSAPIIFYPASGSDSSSGGDQLSTGAIVGIVIGVVAFVVICAAAFYFLVIDGGAVMGTAKRTSPGQSTAPAINFPGGAGGDQAFVTNPVQINKSPMH